LFMTRSSIVVIDAAKIVFEITLTSVSGSECIYPVNAMTSAPIIRALALTIVCLLVFTFIWNIGVIDTGMQSFTSYRSANTRGEQAGVNRSKILLADDRKHKGQRHLDPKTIVSHLKDYAGESCSTK
jgi:hypothetical protein